jgi:CCR4-NOT transcription complex subunit 1
MNKLNDETRLCFLNSIVNELRYPNSHTFHFCLILIFLFMECKPLIQEQISAILFERLQSFRPYPLGLMINFRELI